MGRTITFTKGFKDYKKKYGLTAALNYLIGFYSIKRGSWGRFQKKAKEALRAKRKSLKW